MNSQTPTLPWLEPGQNFPPISETWGHNSPAPGLLAAGGSLDPATLCHAYRQGVFPWYGVGEPILWWSPDPRMVLDISKFKLHPSLKKSIRQFNSLPLCQIRFDTAFEQVIKFCASRTRQGQKSSWIVPEMVYAYCALHEAGFAHSVETWINGELVGGLYCVSIGKSLFGESMFSLAKDASKIALAALVCFCRHNAILQIDCQQNTAHLAFLGAGEISRDQFVQNIGASFEKPDPIWTFDPIFWNYLIQHKEYRI